MHQISTVNKDNKLSFNVKINPFVESKGAAFNSPIIEVIPITLRGFYCNILKSFRETRFITANDPLGDLKCHFGTFFSRNQKLFYSNTPKRFPAHIYTQIIAYTGFKIYRKAFYTLQLQESSPAGM